MPGIIPKHIAKRINSPCNAVGFGGAFVIGNEGIAARFDLHLLGPGKIGGTEEDVQSVGKACGSANRILEDSILKVLLKNSREYVFTQIFS